MSAAGIKPSRSSWGAERAAYAALRGSAIDDPDSGALSGQFYEPIDNAARAALDKEDLGHGISGRTFRS
jgi:hypothetical protein